MKTREIRFKNGEPLDPSHALTLHEAQTNCAEFMTAAGQTIRYTPAEPMTLNERTRCARLILEETLETIRDGLCLDVEPAELSLQTAADVELWEREPRTDNRELADGIADALYVLLCAANAAGIDAARAFREAHRSNMSKFDGGHRDEKTGKWIKGPNYSPADFDTVLAGQIPLNTSRITYAHYPLSK